MPALPHLERLHKAQLTILLLTGDEHFVEMSAFEAAQMLKRRQQRLGEEATPANSHVRELYDTSLPVIDGPAANSEEDILEISEEYDESLHGLVQHSSPAPTTETTAVRDAAVAEQGWKSSKCSGLRRLCLVVALAVALQIMDFDTIRGTDIVQKWHLRHMAENCIPVEGIAEHDSSSAAALRQASADEQALMSRMDELEAQEAVAEAAAKEKESSMKAAEPADSKQEDSNPQQHRRKNAGDKSSLR